MGGEICNENVFIVHRNVRKSESTTRLIEASVFDEKSFENKAVCGKL